jgi:hypothetical protein
VAAGLSYPLAKDLEGLYSPLSSSVLVRFPSLDIDERANWMRTLGVRAIVTGDELTSSRLQLVSVGGRFGGNSRLYAVEAPAPFAWWPRTVAAASSAGDAFRAVSRAADPVGDVIAARPVTHHQGAKLTLIEDTPDRIGLDVWGDGGLLVLRRAFQPLFKATAGGRPLSTLPVNLSLLGVEVPPGNHRVWIEVGAGPEALAGAIAVVALLGALFLAFPIQRLW